MKEIVEPHGGILKPLLVSDVEHAKALHDEAKSLQRINLSSMEISDLIMMASGAFSPLDGFMGQEDYQAILNDMCLSDGTIWPIPITLSISKEESHRLRVGQKISLVDPKHEEFMGVMTIKDKYFCDKKIEAQRVFGTTDQRHPGVAKLYKQDEYRIGGSVAVLSEGEYPSKYVEYARPQETRILFEERGWNKITAFQTRNPIHRSHEYLVKIALEVSDGVLIHPIVGRLKEGDIPAEVRLRCYRVLLDRYFPSERVVLKVYPMEMRYGGPREAVLHAIIRQNFGCSHLIVGRDHAGVGNYYGPFEAQEIFDQLPEGSLRIKPLKLDWTFWCYACGGMASMKTCPHEKDERLLISGTELRRMLSEGRKPPAEFSRSEVLEILIDYYRNHQE
jgi:sulfate adenylyltransferase